MQEVSRQKKVEVLFGYFRSAALSRTVARIFIMAEFYLAQFCRIILIQQPVVVHWYR
jgi:hypothetical protein